MTDEQLFYEELRQQNIELKASIDSLIKIFKEGKIDVGFQPTDKVKIDGAVQVNTQKEVTVDNLETVVDELRALSNTLAEAIKNNAHKPLEAVTVKNIDKARPEVVKITNLSELKEYFATISQAVKDNQPIVNVTKQEIVFPTAANKPIAVRLSDGKSFYTALSASITGGMNSQGIINAIENMSVSVDTTGLATETKQDDIITAIEGIGGDTEYVTLIDETTTTNVTYIGKAVPTGSAIATSSAVWQITRIDESTSPTTIKYADGDLLFTHIWDDRVTETYN